MEKKDPAGFRTWFLANFSVEPLFFRIWSAVAGAFSLFLVAISPAIPVKILSVLFAAGIVGINALLARSHARADSYGPKQFAAVKKSANYFALAVFCFHSVALIFSWSAGKLDDFSYYVVYAVALACSATYLPVFLALVNKRNQEKHGLLESFQKGGRTRYRQVKLYSGPVPWVLSWVDAFVWAATLVIFVNSLFFQLYQIPSESMVPELYVGTRVFTVKTLTNPEIPLSLVKFPWVTGMNRYNQVVLNNPRYETKKERAVQDFVGNFLYMLSFTLIKNDKFDDNGSQIADPLIKRLIGLPGEKLMMVDDVVMVKTKDDARFKPLQGDSAFAYNLKSSRAVDRRRIQSLILTEDRVSKLKAWDEEKKAFTFSDAVAKLQAWRDGLAAGKIPASSGSIPATVKVKFHFDARQALTPAELDAYAAWFRTDRKGFLAELDAFLFSWKSSPAPGSAFEENALKVDLLFKLKLADVLGKALASGTAATEMDVGALNDFAFNYVQNFFDSRNFAPFPAGDAYLAKDEYFFLGDNRYNSLDCRNWSSLGRRKPLSALDPRSLEYISIAEAFSVKAGYIRGLALFAAF